MLKYYSIILHHELLRHTQSIISYQPKADKHNRMFIPWASSYLYTSGVVTCNK